MLRNPLLMVLGDAQARTAFRDFALRHHAEENIDFYVAAEAFKANKGCLSTKLVAGAKFVFETYLTDHSPRWVCLQSDTLEAITARMKDESSYDRGMFVSAQKEVVYCIQLQIFPNFMESLAVAKAKHLSRVGSSGALLCEEDAPHKSPKMKRSKLFDRVARTSSVRINKRLGATTAAAV